MPFEYIILFSNKFKIYLFFKKISITNKIRYILIMKYLFVVVAFSYISDLIFHIPFSHNLKSTFALN